MDNNCPIPDLVQAFSNVENGCTLKKLTKGFARTPASKGCLVE